MGRSRARWICARAAVCSWILASGLLAKNARAVPAVVDLPETAAAPGVVVFAARATGPRPITVVLHGMCGDAARTCSHFVNTVTESAHLVCPRASARCEGGGASFPEPGVEEAVESAVARAKSILGEVDESHGRTLIGYSLGAFRALRIAQTAADVYPRVMLIGAKITLDQQKLEHHGVERLLLCAGNWDMMHDHMRREAARVQGSEVATRFLDLGSMGHGLTANFDEYLPQALAWLSSDQPR